MKFSLVSFIIYFLKSKRLKLICHPITVRGSILYMHVFQKLMLMNSMHGLDIFNYLNYQQRKCAPAFTFHLSPFTFHLAVLRAS